MPQDLAALLVEEGAVSKADMDRAVARQGQLGGALDTALLELELIGEGHLLSFLAHVAALPAAPPGAFREIDARARRVFPAKVAERHRLAPFALDGRELSVVAAHPVDAAAIDEIGFMLSLTLVPHVGIEWRVHDLIHRLYGGQLSARLAKLADAALEIAPPPAPPEPPEPVEPEPASPAPPLSVEEAFFAAGETAGSTPKIELPPRSAAPAGAAPSPGGGEEKASGEAAPSAGGGGAKEDDETSFADFEPERPRPSGFGSDGSEPAEPLLAALELAVEAYDALWVEPGAEPEAARSEPPEEPGTSVVPSAGEAPAAAAPEGGPQAPPSEEAPPEEGEEDEEPLRELDRSAPPRWSIDDARAALAAARHRDEVVITALRFTRDFFEFSALFAVTRDAVVGHDALGSQEDERARCRGTAIYANDPGIVKTVLETRAPYLGPASRDVVGTANILDGLWRGTPRTVLLYPILVADRAVAVLYADNGEAPVSARRLGDLLLFLSTAGGTFERIIRSRKKRPRRAAPRPAPSPPPAVLPEPGPEGPEPEWMAGPRDAAEIESPPHAAAPTGAAPSPGGGDERSSVEGALSSAVGDGRDSGVTVSPAAGEGMDSGGTISAVGEREMNPIPSRVDGAMAALLSGAPATPDGALTILDLVLDSDPGVAAAAREALTSHRRESAVKPLPERLRSALLSGVGERPVLAARALGALRDVASIPILIQALETGSRQGADAAAEALTGITLQRYGASPQKWLKWWKENRGRSRAEWLFAALNSPDRELRLAASGELRAAGEPPVRYTVDLPGAELEAASRAWWVWWSRQGFSV